MSTELAPAAAPLTPAPIPKGRVPAFGIYLIVLNLVLMYVLVKIWPGKMPPPDTETVSLLWGMPAFPLLLETRYLLIVALAGALGSFIHLATSFADYVGNRDFRPSWIWWYILRPFIGMALALILYFVVRGGLIAGNSSAGNLSPYGVAAIAGMAGMFSRQATDKLQEVFSNLFKTDKPPTRADKLRETTAQPEKPSDTTTVQPASAAAKAATTD